MVYSKQLIKQVFLAIGIFILLGSVGFYVLRLYQTNANKTLLPSTQNSLIGWNTYANNRYHFSVQYPPTLYIHGEDEFSIALRLVSLNDSMPIIDQPLFTVAVLQGTSSLNDLIKANPYVDPSMFHKTIIKGYPAMWHERTTNAVLNSLGTEIEYQNHVYQVMLTSDTITPDLRQIYNQLVTTFKFTD